MGTMIMAFRSVVCASVVTSAATSALAANKYWIGGSSDWGFNYNWSNTPGGAASSSPVAGDDATISLSTTQVITRGALSSSYTSPLDSLVLDGLNGASVTLAQSQTNFLVNSMDVAGSANSKALLNLTGGYISASSAYYGLGTNSVATFSMAGSGSYSGFCNIGYGVNSNAVFNQTAGTFTDGGADLFIARGGDATAHGTYNLTAGYMNVVQEIDVGETGSGTFHQSGGNAFASNITVGGGTAGNFILDGGSFTSTAVNGGFVDYIAANGKIFSQAATQGGNFYVRGNMLVDGGSVDVSKINFDQDDGGSTLGYLTVQNGGTFNSSTYYDNEGTLSTNVLSGANFTASTVLYLGGNCTFTLSNATLNAGTISNSNPGNLIFNSGTINITGSGGASIGYTNYYYNFIGTTPDLTSSKALGITGPLTILPNASVTLDGGTLSAATIALSGNGTFLYHTGTLRFTGSNFTLGSGQLLGDTLELPNTRSIVTTGAYQVMLNSGATLYMDGGSLSAGGGVSNYGTVQLASTLSRISGGLLSNVGTISGTGRIDSVLSNTGTVQAGSGDHVSFTASGNGNGGTLQLLGGIIDFAQDLTNNGRITGRGSLFANGNLTNNGTMLLSGGPADIYGAVTNSVSGKIYVTGGSDTTFYNNVLNNSTITVDPSSTVAFLGSFSGGSVTGTGTQIYRAASSGVAIDNAGTAVVDQTGSLNASHVRAANLTLMGPAVITSNGGTIGTSRLNSLSINGSTDAWTTKLDLTNNSLVVDYTGASPLATIQNQIKNGYSGGAWTGNGLTSSLADATHHGLGYAEAFSLTSAPTGTFGGQAFDNTSVLVKYTFYGDANLDGVVNIADLGMLATNYGKSSQAWSAGDFNYDGSVNIADLGVLATNYGAGASSPLPESFQQALAEVEATSGVQLPEPGALALLPLLAGLRRRRRD